MGTGEEKQLGGECGGGARLHHFPVNQAGRRRPTPGAGAVPGPGRLCRAPSPPPLPNARLAPTPPPGSALRRCLLRQVWRDGGMEGWVDE